MMPLMAKKKPTTEGQDPAPGAPKRTGVPLHVWVAPETMRLLEAYLESMEFPTTKTAVTEAALLQFLKEKGFVPRK
jgi:hypothetical protein